MIPRHRFVPLLIALAACGQEARKLDGQPVVGPDSMAAMGDMPGMVMDPPAPDGPKPPPGELSLTAVQIERGGVAHQANADVVREAVAEKAFGETGGAHQQVARDGKGKFNGDQ